MSELTQCLLLRIKSTLVCFSGQRLLVQPSEEQFAEAALFQSSPFLHDGVEGVEEGVECRVDGQHEDGHGHADLARDGSSLRGQQTQETDGEPAEEVGHGHGDEPASDGQVLGAPAAVVDRHAAGVDWPVDEALPHGDEQEEEEVEDDHHAEGVGVAGKRLPGDGQRDADACLAVEVPVGRDGQQRHRGQSQPQAPRESAGQVGRGSLEVVPAEGEP